MFGSIFRLNSIDRISDSDVWIVRMTFCSDEEHDLKEVLMDMKQRDWDIERNLLRLGRELLDMRQFDLFEECFVHTIESIVPEAPFIINLYEEIAENASRSRHADKSMEWHEKVIVYTKQFRKLIKDHILLRNTNSLINLHLLLKKRVILKALKINLIKIYF